MAVKIWVWGEVLVKKESWFCLGTTSGNVENSSVNTGWGQLDNPHASACGVVLCTFFFTPFFSFYIFKFTIERLFTPVRFLFCLQINSEVGRVEKKDNKMKFEELLCLYDSFLYGSFRACACVRTFLRYSA